MVGKLCQAKMSVQHRQCPKPSRDKASLALDEARHTCSGDESSHPTTDAYEGDSIVIPPSTPPQQDTATTIINAPARSSQRDRQPSIKLHGNVEGDRDGSNEPRKAHDAD